MGRFERRNKKEISMKDITCPKCKHEYDHDGDFEGLSNNNELCEYCPECETTFYVYVDFYPHFSDGYLVK